MRHEEIREAAIAEVIDPTFEQTKQLLSSNKVVFEDGIPVIENIVINEKEKIAYVYFVIEDEPFYLQVNIDIATIVTPSFMFMSPGSRVYFTAVSDEPNLDEMLSSIDFEPTLKWEKGQKRNVSGAYNHSRIVYEPIKMMSVEVEDKFKALIDFLWLRKEEIQSLSKISDGIIQVAYYGYKEQMWGIHLGKELLQKISELALPIDIDLYASGNDLESIP